MHVGVKSLEKWAHESVSPGKETFKRRLQEKSSSFMVTGPAT